MAWTENATCILIALFACLSTPPYLWLKTILADPKTCQLIAGKKNFIDIYLTANTKKNPAYENKNNALNRCIFAYCAIPCLLTTTLSYLSYKAPHNIFEILFILSGCLCLSLTINHLAESTKNPAAEIRKPQFKERTANKKIISFSPIIKILITSIACTAILFLGNMILMHFILSALQISF